MENNNILNFFYKLPQNIGKVFSGKNLIWQALVMVLTFFFAVSGFDWTYHQATQIAWFWPVLFPAVLLGFIAPFLAPLVLLVCGYIKKNFLLLNTAFALGQAAALGWVVSAFYKFFTGRPGPDYMGNTGDITHIFRFGLGRGGVFWGWPSSHTTVAFAMSMALYTLFPENKFIKFSSLAYAIYITISVSMTIHWFSDCIAGIIFGSLVGIMVGKSFLQRYNTAVVNN